MRQRRRFADVKLGDIVEFDGDAVAGADWAERARLGVAAWAGCAHADLGRVLGPGTFARDGMQLTGRVYARHLDGSRFVDVQVVGRDRDHICASAIVRVALA
ncbi:MAG: hypothetical protein ACOY45_08215 [Pseudomonadota bacterium]